ncbi:acid ceramidase-like [Hetaerina americana]|uniref:acid ceramidase-like n=1 Tax=Hetaerina americana TaxID=62018 RepID=UPI003A7F5B10
MRSGKHVFNTYIFLCLGFISAYSLIVVKSDSNDVSTTPIPEYPPFKGCVTNARQTSQSDELAVYKIDLNAPPRKRWSALVKDFRKEITGLIEATKKNFEGIFGRKIFYLIDTYVPVLAKTLPKEYYEEMVGIAEVINAQLGEIVFFNVFYELFTVCTSIIIESPTGEIYHGRNLDFGLFMGWNVKNSTWITTEFLKKLAVKLEFHKNGTVLYTSINFAGYIGILTGVKKDLFSLSVNERFRLNGGFIGISEWILGFRNEKWMGMLTRQVMEYADSYNSAQKMLSSPKLLAPVYFILAGKKSHEGSIITRGRDSSDLWTLGEKSHRNASWYLVQTNYDHWKKPPFYDNRRDPAEYCLEKAGPQHPEKTLQGVLSTRPVLNKLTVLSATMQAASGKLDVWLQDCPDPCWPW